MKIQNRLTARATALCAACITLAGATTAITGCASEAKTGNGGEAMASPAPSAPAPLAAASPSPSPTPSIDEVAISEEAATPYRVRTDYVGKSDVEFKVFVDGAQVGIYNTDKVNANLTPFLSAGKTHAVRVTWIGDPNMPRYGHARLLIEAERGGAWSTVVSREVRRTTGSGESTIALGDVPGGDATTTVVAAANEQPMEAPQGEAVEGRGKDGTPARFANQYIVKVQIHPYAPAAFTLAVNGETVGDFTADASQDLAPFLKPGRNQVTVTARRAGPTTNKFSQSKLTIGEEHEGKWHTVANVVVGTEAGDAVRTTSFLAQ